MDSLPKRPKTNPVAWLVLLLVLTAGGAALQHILQARYESGEGYPQYSSMRADPLGTRALWESVNQLQGVTASRNFADLKFLEGNRRKTLILAGLSAKDFNESHALNTRALTLFASGGGRVIIALEPKIKEGRLERVGENAEKQARRELTQQKPEKQSSPAPTPKTAPKRNGPEPVNATLAQAFRIKTKAVDFVLGPNGGHILTPGPTSRLASEELPRWFSNDFFERLEASSYLEMADLPAAGTWNEVATKDGKWVVAERRMGAGSIVLCSDRYFLSNEALWKEPRAAFLSWLFGGATEVVFEETHFGYGIGDSEGVMTLARRYGMQGLFFVGFLLFVLAVWRQSFSLVPPDPMEDLGHWRQDAIAGHSAASGLEGLLRRGIPARDLLKRCWEAWEASKAATSSIPQVRRDTVRELIYGAPKDADAAALYRQSVQILNPKS
jgi:hypothetical protein